MSHSVIPLKKSGGRQFENRARVSVAWKTQGLPIFPLCQLCDYTMVGGFVPAWCSPPKVAKAVRKEVFPLRDFLCYRGRHPFQATPANLPHFSLAWLGSYATPRAINDEGQQDCHDVVMPPCPPMSCLLSTFQDCSLNKQYVCTDNRIYNYCS